MKKFLVIASLVLFSSSFAIAEEGKLTLTDCTNNYQKCEQTCAKKRLPDEKGNQCYSACLKEYEDCQNKVNEYTLKNDK